MRLNVDNYRSILGEKQISDEYVQKAIGLSEKTYLWILDNGFIECETLERIADAIGCNTGEILRPDYDGYAENVIEWVKDSKKATLSLSQQRTISRIRKLAEKYPDDVQILADNKDGSLYAHIPIKWIKISPSKEMTEKQIEQARKNFQKVRSVRAD